MPDQRTVLVNLEMVEADLALQILKATLHTPAAESDIPKHRKRAIDRRVGQKVFHLASQSAVAPRRFVPFLGTPVSSMMDGDGVVVRIALCDQTPHPASSSHT